MNNEIKACCFTGYRPHKFSFSLTQDNIDYTTLENKLCDAVFSLPEMGCYKFYCGMASGFDLIAGETVATLKRAIVNSARVELIAVVPFKRQEDTFKKEWQERYRALLKKADKIVYISDVYSRGCYRARNEYMVDNSDIIITWYDGQNGGTAQTLRYAERQNKKIVNIAQETVHEACEISPYVVEK